MPGLTHRSFWLSIVVFGLFLAFAMPTMAFVARESWSTEQGAHGPIVLFTGLWLLLRLWPEAASVAVRPPSIQVWAAALIILPAYAIARISSTIELEGYLMYLFVVLAIFSMVGFSGLKRLWFPIFYLAFVFPLPDSLVALVTQPMKIAVSQGAVGLLSIAGYPVGGEGVFIYIGQYQLLVAAACSGLNSIISLSAISLLYIYLRHRARLRYALLMAMFIVPVALVANLVRVLILILLTYYFGEAVGQGFLHGFAGVTMFVAALLVIMGVDLACMRILNATGGHKDGKG